MATIQTLTKAKANDILGQSVVSGTINGSGHLILTKQNGQTIDAGDFTGIVTGILNDAVATQIAATLPAAVATATAGSVVDRGTISGVFSFAGATVNNLVNAMYKATLNGNLTVQASDLPANPKPNTQFAMRLKQDATGGRTLTLAGFKKSQGVVTLTTAANAIDMIVFIFDGTDWFAGLMGVDFK